MTLRILSPIHKATRQIGLHLDDQLEGFGVSSDEAHLLSYLECYGPAPIYELQRVFGHRPSTLTGLIDRLERRSLVRRDRNPDDGRSYLIGLTGRGRGLAGRVSRLVERLEVRVLERVDDGALQGFREVIDAIAEVAQVEIRQVAPAAADRRAVDPEVRVGNRDGRPARPTVGSGTRKAGGV